MSMLHAPLPALLLGLGLMLATVPAQARTQPQAPAPVPAESVRPAVGRPLQEAQRLVRAGRFRDALSPIAEAERVGGLTDHEALVINQMKGAALAGAGDADGAAAAFGKVLDAGRLPKTEALRVLQSLAGSYLNARNYPKAIEWTLAYRAEGGSGPEVLGILPQAYFLSGDYAKAAREASALIAQAEKTGGKPPEAQLALLASSLAKLGDMAGYRASLETRVRHYPTADAWADLIARTASQPGFSRNLDLDRYRLLRATGNLRQASHYMEAAQLAVQAGLPGEARSILDEGYRKQVLGTGEAAQVARQNRLKAMVEQRVAEEQAALAASAAVADATLTGDQLVRTGLAHVSHGDTARGLPMMEQGIRKGSAKSADHSLLHLGYAFLQAGDRARGLAALRQVQGTDGAADLARLWTLFAGPQ